MSADPRRLSVDSEALQNRIDQLGAIGDVHGSGLFRGSYTPAWAEAVLLVRSWMDRGGLRTWQDAVGNLYGRLEGMAAGPVVLTGSHIDTVPNGGRYDGALGVHASLTAVLALKDAFGTPRTAIDILVICDEEGSRFSTDFWGARAVIGAIQEGEAERHRDVDGVSIGEAMRQAGFDPVQVPGARRDDVSHWLELHIEQGGTLEAKGLDLGVVHTITGHRQQRVRLAGRQDHAGTTPMDVRRDTMAGAVEIIGRAMGIAEQLGRPAVCTAGWLQAEPGAFNVVPGSVSFSLDLRHSDARGFATLTEGVERACQEVADRRRLGLEVQPIMDRSPVSLDSGLRDLLADSAQRAGFQWKSMPSMAGHDTEVMIERWPSAMLFVPSRDGRSHSPAEYTPVEQVIPGVQVLAAALHRLAY